MDRFRVSRFEKGAAGIPPPRAHLEGDPQGKLNLSRGGWVSAILPKGCIRRSQHKSTPSSNRSLKVGPVQNIKKLGPELNVSRLTYGKDLLQGDVKVGQSGSFRRIASQVPKETP